MNLAQEITGAEVRQTFVALAELYCYPDAAYAARLELALREIRRVDADAAKSLEAFDAAISDLDMNDLQWAFTSTFDLAPSCNPYIGAHVFGDESRERAQFLVGLRQRYAEAGRDEPRELPDHIAVVFAFSAAFSDEEWTDLGRLVLAPALAKMHSLLRETSNPYRHLVAATRTLVETVFGDVRSLAGGQS